MERARDYWAHGDRNLLDRWPRDASGEPERAVSLGIQWEMDSLADITVSMLEGCGIPAFKEGSLGKVRGASPLKAWTSWSPPPGWRRPGPC